MSENYQDKWNELGTYLLHRIEEIEKSIQKDEDNTNNYAQYYEIILLLNQMK